ncbi:hypothetical protein C8R45DRAFT_81496 [Mycena sanguinolenta]|nr:hypothetical protein C8R45DRAFT_81496 [Mycena sanguinolenta]
MSQHLLPDEIISEILSPALKVPDELFCDNEDVSPFAKNSESTSAYLLVCKSWLRVATPLLYNIVVLRSKAQAKALSVALSGNKELGQFIKKLRVEGGYGLPIQTILQCAPNISDLFLSLIIYSSDNTIGLCRGLQLINPTRLILQDQTHKPLENKMASQLLEALIRAMYKWDRLCSFDFPYTFDGNRATKLMQPLAESKRLHTLAIPSSRGLSWTYSVLKECPLKVIQIKHPMIQWERKWIEQKHPELKALLKFTEEPVIGMGLAARAEEPIPELPLIAPSLDPFFIAMAGAPKEVQDKVWDRVLYFAMAVPERADESPWVQLSCRRLPLLLVSKGFARLGLPHHYAHVRLRQSSTIPQFAFVLRNNPSIGPQIRSLTIDYWDYPDFDSDGEGEPAPFHQLDSSILSQTTGLVRLNRPSGSATIPWDAFEAVAKSSGSTLQECCVRIGEQEQAASAMIFSNLSAMRTLKWDCSISFLLTNVPGDGLQNLTELRISSTSETFLMALMRMELKCLQRVMLLTNHLKLEPFLEAHGPKLIELRMPFGKLGTLTAKILELCPNLRSLSLVNMGFSPTGNVLLVDDLGTSQAVPSLVKITLDMYFRTRNKDQVTGWERFFSHFEPKCLPNLREIEVLSCVWPTNERDIPKSHWVRWAEIMLKRGISITDKNGAKWRPRLKIR